MLATQAMSEALYISSGDYTEDDFYHYGLAAEFYTHFTSPIRRYADVIVHRLLSESIKKEKLKEKYISSSLTPSEVRDICKHINIQNRNAKLASMDSTRLFHGLYFKGKQESNENGVQAEGIVYSIRKNGLVVLVPEYGIKGNIYFNDQQGNSTITNVPVSSTSSKFSNAELSGIFKYSNVNEQETIVFNSTKGDINVTKFTHCIVEINVSEST